MIYSTRGRQPKVYRLPPSCIALNGILLLSLCGGTLAGVLGYSSQSYFQRVFKKVVGVTPGKYRADGKPDGPASGFDLIGVG